MPGKKLILILAVLAIPVLYGLDDLSLRIGVPSRPRYATFTIDRFYYISEKFHKYSYEPLPPVEEQCVNSLLPHLGARPCWYVARHTMQTIAVN